MNADKQLHNPDEITVRQTTNPVRGSSLNGTKTNPYVTVRLSEVLGQLMDGRISPRYAMLGPVIQTWGRLLPAELARHCRPTEVCGGKLKVLVDLPPYMYELRLCSSQLLAELNRQCPRSRIKKLKFVMADSPIANYPQ